MEISETEASQIDAISKELVRVGRGVPSHLSNLINPRATHRVFSIIALHGFADITTSTSALKEDIYAVNKTTSEVMKIGGCLKYLEKLEIDKRLAEQEETELKKTQREKLELEIQVGALQKEKLEYEKTLRDRKERIDTLTEENLIFKNSISGLEKRLLIGNLIRQYKWYLLALVGIGGGVDRLVEIIRWWLK